MADFECKRCGRCCSSAFLALHNILVEDDKQEIAQWLKYHGCEPMHYPGKDGDVLAVNIPISCEHLSSETGTRKAVCLIYENRPNVCKNYFCKPVKDECVRKLANGIGL